MSSGNFTDTFYEADNGDIHPIRVQPETLLAVLGAANSAPAGPLTVPLSARARKPRRAFGLGARTARVKFTATPPTGYALNQTLTIPILSPSIFASITKGVTGTYLSTAVKVVGTTSESRV